MNTWKVKKHSGFSIMELMIVIVIVAILVSLAYPSYVQYVRKAKRGEAQQLLMNWSINQEIWRSNNVQYATTAELPEPSLDDYTFTLPTQSATAYSMQAAATGDQLKDVSRDGTSCTPLTLGESGIKLPAVCWD